MARVRLSKPTSQTDGSKGRFLERRLLVGLVGVLEARALLLAAATGLRPSDGGCCGERRGLSGRCSGDRSIVLPSFSLWRCLQLGR
jgi:hypothetical protein